MDSTHWKIIKMFSITLRTKSIKSKWIWSNLIGLWFDLKVTLKLTHLYLSSIRQIALRRFISLGSITPSSNGWWSRGFIMRILINLSVLNIIRIIRWIWSSINKTWPKNGKRGQDLGRCHLKLIMESSMSWAIHRIQNG
jgi:hypothetical protein